MSALETLLKSSYDEYLKLTGSSVQTVNTPQFLFDVFFKKCIQYHDTPVHTLQEMRTIKSTKAKGDLFERFCQRYLLTICEYDQVWLLRELTDELKTQLKLPLGWQDYGIDLVAVKKGKYSAIQCKFKAPRPPIQVRNRAGQIKTIYPCVNWKELSTFNELCNASGPWERRITMTTAKSVRRLGGIKNDQDLSICLQGLQGLTSNQWRAMMSSLQGTKVSSLQGTKVSYDPSGTEDGSIDPSSSSEPSTSTPSIKIKLQLKKSILEPTSAVPRETPSLPEETTPKIVKKTPIRPKKVPSTNVLSQEQLRDKRLQFLQRSGIISTSQN